MWLHSLRSLCHDDGAVVQEYHFNLLTAAIIAPTIVPIIAVGMHHMHSPGSSTFVRNRAYTVRYTKGHGGRRRQGGNEEEGGRQGRREEGREERAGEKRVGGREGRRGREGGGGREGRRGRRTLPMVSLRKMLIAPYTSIIRFSVTIILSTTANLITYNTYHRCRNRNRGGGGGGTGATCP